MDYDKILHIYRKKEINNKTMNSLKRDLKICLHELILDSGIDVAYVYIPVYMSKEVLDGSQNKID